MYARLQATSAPLPETDDPDAMRRQVAGTIAGHPGFAGLYMLEQIGTAQRMMLTLWQTQEDAEHAPERTREQLGPRPFELETDETFEVVGDWSGAAGTEPAKVVAVLRFEAPMSQARFAAGQRAVKERIQPALAAVGGLVRSLTLWDGHARELRVVHLATSPETIEASAQAVNSTELLPGEDPALLTGPRRVDIYRVAESELAIATSS